MSAGCGGVSQKEVRLSKRRSVRGCHGGLRAGACVEDETHWDASGALGSGRSRETALRCAVEELAGPSQMKLMMNF